MNGQIAWDEDLELIEEMQDCEYQDLPVVDDLEVAALAAEAAMEAVKIAEDNGRQPLGVTSSSSEVISHVNMHYDLSALYLSLLTIPKHDCPFSVA